MPESNPTIRVLVVDDDSTLRRLMSTMLERRGLHVVGTAADGNEAVAAVRKLQPDVVLMDYQMPGMDGIAATRVLKQLPSAPKVVLFTADDLGYVEPLAREAGSDAVLAKGTAPQQIDATLTRVVASRQILRKRAA